MAIRFTDGYPVAMSSIQRARQLLEKIFYSSYTAVAGVFIKQLNFSFSLASSSQVKKVDSFCCNVKNSSSAQKRLEAGAGGTGGGGSSGGGGNEGKRAGTI